MRNLLQEFLTKHDGVRHPTILGLREHIFTGRYVANYNQIKMSCIFYFSLLFSSRFYAAHCSLIIWCSVSSLAWFMSNQETSFVTIGQRLLDKPLR